MNSASLSAVIEHVGERGGCDVGTHHHGKQVHVDADDQKRAVSERLGREVEGAFVNPEMNGALGHVLRSPSEDEAAPACFSPCLCDAPDRVGSGGVHHTDTTGREVDRVNTKTSTCAVHGLADLFGSTNGGCHGRQSRSAGAPWSRDAPFPPTNVFMFYAVGKAASFVHGQGLLDHGTRKMVDFHFCGTRVKDFSERSQGRFTDQGPALVHEKGTNRSTCGQGQHTRTTVRCPGHQAPAQAEGGRVCEHHFEHFGASAPNLEHFPAWPIQHLAPSFSGHDGV